MKLSNILWGIVLIILGVIIGLNALDITHIDIFFKGWWTFLIIIPCFIEIFRGKDTIGNSIGLIIGVPVLLEFVRTRYITKVPSAILATGIMTFSIIIAQCGVILDTVVKQNKENYEIQLIRFQQLNKIDK